MADSIRNPIVPAHAPGESRPIPTPPAGLKWNDAVWPETPDAPERTPSELAADAAEMERYRQQQRIKAIFDQALPDIEAQRRKAREDADAQAVERAREAREDAILRDIQKYSR